MLGRVLPLFALVGVSFLPVGDGLARQEKQEKDRQVVVVSPKDGEKVEQFTDVEGQLNTREGWPLLLVKPLIGSQAYWVQSSIEAIENGKFNASAQFGDEKTESGTRFRIVIVLLRNKAEAHKYKPGTTMNAPPVGPRSENITVIRK